MKWQKFKSIEDLKKEYKNLKELREEIKKEFPQLHLKLNTWLNTWVFIESINKFLEKEIYIFTLLNVDNPSRRKILDLNEEIILEKSNLKKWRNRISKIIAPDKNNNSKESNEATKKLNEIYDELKKYE